MKPVSSLCSSTYISSTPYSQAEAARKRGTPVTPESFALLRKRLTDRLKEARRKAEEDRVKSLAPKEKEEYKKIQARQTGEWIAPLCCSKNWIPTRIIL